MDYLSYICIILKNETFTVHFLAFSFQVVFQISSLHVHFSPSIYGAALELAAFSNNLIANPGFQESDDSGPLDIASNGHDDHFFGFSVCIIVQSVRFEIDLENDEKNASAIMLALEDVEIWYALLFVNFS